MAEMAEILILSSWAESVNVNLCFIFVYPSVSTLAAKKKARNCVSSYLNKGNFFLALAEGCHPSKFCFFPRFFLSDLIRLCL